MSPSMMNVSAALSCTAPSPSIRFSYIARARSSTSHAALKSSSGSASSSPSPSPSPSPASSSPSVSGLDASANNSTAGSPSSTSSASPENDRILFPFAAGSVVRVQCVKGRKKKERAPSSCCCCCCSFPRTEFCTMAFSSNAFPYAKYTSAISGASSSCVSDLRLCRRGRRGEERRGTRTGVRGRWHSVRRLARTCATRMPFSRGRARH